MSRATIIIHSHRDRIRASTLLENVPFGTRVAFKAAKRSIPQNDRMWAMLTDVAQQLPWHGVKLRADDWKILFLDALNREVRPVPSIDGRGFVNLGRSSSDLSKGEMGDLISLIDAFGTQHGVIFQDTVRSVNHSCERPASPEKVRSPSGAGQDSRPA